MLCHRRMVASPHEVGRGRRHPRPADVAAEGPAPIWPRVVEQPPQVGTTEYRSAFTGSVRSTPSRQALTRATFAGRECCAPSPAPRAMGQCCCWMIALSPYPPPAIVRPWPWHCCRRSPSGTSAAIGCETHPGRTTGTNHWSGDGRARDPVIARSAVSICSCERCRSPMMPAVLAQAKHFPWPVSRSSGASSQPHRSTMLRKSRHAAAARVYLNEGADP